MKKQNKPISYLIGQIFSTLTIIILLTACNDANPQALPTLAPVATVAQHAELVEATLPTAEPIEVVVDSEQVVMTLWHNWQAEQATALIDLLATYEATRPNVHVALVYQENLTDALKTAVPLQEGPDFILMQQNQLGQFAEEGLITPITTYFDASTMTETFSPAATTAMEWQEDVWGIPALQESIAIIYNKARIDESVIPDDITDFESLLTNAIAYHQANPDSYLLCNQSLSADSLDAYHSAPIFFGFENDEPQGYIDDWGNVFVDTPEKIAAGEWLVAFMEASPAEAGFELCQASFLAGESAAWWTGSWALETLQGSNLDVGIRAFGRPFVHVTGLFLGTNAVERQQQAQIADFLTYWTMPDVQTNLALGVNIAPANRLALSSEAIQSQPTMTAFGEAAAKGIPFPASPYTEAQWEPVGRATSNIITHSQSPAEALTEAQTAVKQTIETLKNQ